MKKLFLLIQAFCISCSLSAYQLSGGGNQTITEPVYEDLYIAGGQITIDAPVYGDLIIAGGQLKINDSVTGDILLAGGSAEINGFVSDDIRCVGGTLTIGQNVAGDVIAAGGSIIIRKGVTVGGLVVNGGEVQMLGDVLNNAIANGGKITLSGSIGKNLEAHAGELVMNGQVAGTSLLSASSISLGQNALFKNNVRYWNSNGKLDFGTSITNGKATYDESLAMSTDKWYYLGFAAFLALLWYLAVAFIFIMLIQYLFSNVMTKAGTVLNNHGARSLGYGLLFLLAIPIAAIIIMITVIGVPVGALALLAYIILLAFSSVIISVILSNWYSNRQHRSWSYWKLVWMAFLIFIIIKIVAMIPVVGWLSMLLLTGLAFGALLLTLNFRKREAHTVTAQV